MGMGKIPKFTSKTTKSHSRHLKYGPIIQVKGSNKGDLRHGYINRHPKIAKSGGAGCLIIIILSTIPISGVLLLISSIK
jgi:hypothetical protein